MPIIAVIAKTVLTTFSIPLVFLASFFPSLTTQLLGLAMIVYEFKI